MQHVLRSLNWPGHQLGVKHHIKRVDAKMPLRFLVAPIHFDGVTHGLKCVERQADGQNAHVVFKRVDAALPEQFYDTNKHPVGAVGNTVGEIRQVERVEQEGNIFGEEAEVLEKCQNADV